MKVEEKKMRKRKRRKRRKSGKGEREEGREGKRKTIKPQSASHQFSVLPRRGALDIVVAVV